MANVEALTTFNNVLLHHVPNAYAPSALFAILMGAMAWAVMACELAYNNKFDRDLLTSPGWRYPLRAATRAIYFVMRLGCMLNLTLSLVYQNVPGLDCVPFYGSLRVTWYLSVICVDFIFYTRTMALYGWQKKIWIPVTVATCFYVTLGAYNTARWGTPFQIPKSDFCGFITTDIRKHDQLQVTFLVQYASSLTMDTVVLVLTCLRLWKTPASDRAGASWKTQSGRPLSQVPRNSISRALIIQGFILYGSLELSHLALVLVYFAADYTQAWSSAVYTMILLLKVVTASILVRLTSEAVRKTQLDPTSQTVSNRSGQSATTAAISSKHDAPLQEKSSADIESQADNDNERPTFEVTTVQHVHTLTFDERQERSRLASALGNGHYTEEDA